MKPKRVDSVSSALELEAMRNAKNAAQRRDTRKKNEQEGLNEPPHSLPIETSGLSGAKLQAEIVAYREKLERRNQGLSKNGLHPLRLKTLKESVLETVRTFEEAGRKKRVPTTINELQISDLFPFLPRFDWRDYQIVAAVRDQFNSPNCWAFTATQIFESSLMIQRANFAMNKKAQLPNIFLIDNVELNARSTFECLQSDDSAAASLGGRYETAFNFFIKRGILKRDIKLALGVPVKDAPGVELSGDDRVIAEVGIANPEVVALDGAAVPNVRDGDLLSGHCQERTRRIKALGWDYVREKNPWKIPQRDALKKALLEHGPLAVGINTQGTEHTLSKYGRLKIDDSYAEVGRNQAAGVVFKKHADTQDIFVRIPKQAFSLGAKETNVDQASIMFEFSQPDTYKNLNLTRDELIGSEFLGMNSNVYSIQGAASQMIRQGTHRRRAIMDRDVGTFYDKETNEIICHFPASNDVRLETDSRTGQVFLSFPANAETVITKHDENAVTVEIPVRKDFEDLTPVFHLNPNEDMNHYVVMIGWDDRKQAWIILNSWGDDWGYACHPQRGTRGHGYVAYGDLGQFAAWLEANLLEKKLWRRQAEAPK